LWEDISIYVPSAPYLCDAFTSQFDASVDGCGLSARTGICYLLQALMTLTEMLRDQRGAKLKLFVLPAVGEMLCLVACQVCAFSCIQLKLPLVHGLVKFLHAAFYIRAAHCHP